MTAPMIDAGGFMRHLGSLGALDVDPALPSGTLHAWGAVLPGSDVEEAFCRRMLSDEEIARADRFIFPRDRRRYIISHGLLRLVLARYVDAAPAALRFAHHPAGKPWLDNDPDLHFSLAHSGEATLIAVGRSGEIGADVEACRAMSDASALVERFFSKPEQRAYGKLPADERERAFVAAWTRKEAYIKALGTGMATPLDSFSVNFDLPARLLAPEHPAWTMRHLVLDQSHIGAVAVPLAGPVTLRGGLITL